MTKSEKLKKIYETISDKTRNMGCKIGRYEDEHSKELTIGTYINSYVPNEYTCNPRIMLFNGKIIIGDGDYDYETIGNPCMIGDVLFWIYENMGPYQVGNIINILLSKREDKRKPIEEQSTEAIDFIYSLLS